MCNFFIVFHAIAKLKKQRKDIKTKLIPFLCEVEKIFLGEKTVLGGLLEPKIGPMLFSEYAIKRSVTRSTLAV